MGRFAFKKRISSSFTRFVSFLRLFSSLTLISSFIFSSLMLMLRCGGRVEAELLLKTSTVSEILSLTSIPILRLFGVVDSSAFIAVMLRLLVTKEGGLRGLKEERVRRI